MNKSENQNDKVMFLFGAGISIPIGIPAMQGIFKAFMNKKESGISDSDKKISQFFINEMGVDEDLEEFLLAANSIIEFKDSKITRFVEKSISRVNKASKVIEYNKKFYERLNDVINVKRSILDFLSRVCFRFDRAKALKINKGFVKAIASLGYPVYSTNYDFAFEHVAIEEGVELNDNFIKKGQRFLWNDKIKFPDGTGFKLIKLHGSVTWYIDNAGTIEKIYSSTDINFAGKEIDKIVIVPTRFKDIYAQHFFALYSHFLSSLAKAEVLIIAGHSLRDDYLRAGIIERKRKGNFQLIVIDPQYPKDIKTELPPSRLGTIGDVINVPYKWEQFSDELSSILLNSSIESIAENCIKIIVKRKYTKDKVKIKGNLGVLKANSSKKIKMHINAYLLEHNKPAKLRVWIEASYTNSKGEKKSEISSNFLKTKEILLGDGLSGLVDTDQEVNINIPKIEDWLDSKCKIELVVALVRSYVKKPGSINKNNLIAKESKLLNYRL